MPELKLDRVTKQFKNKIAVEHVSLSLKEGVYGFLGANGAGKTTLLRMLCGILKPTAGEIFCNGTEITKLGGDYRYMLGYLPQDFGYYPDFTAKRYLTYLAACKAVPGEFAGEKVQEVLRLVGLEGEQKSKIRTFSGGMIRRLGIAQVLLNDPEIIVLDEPTSGLDAVVRNDLLDEMREYMKQDGRAILISSHISSDLEGLCDDLYFIQNGQVLFHEDTDVILSNYSILKVNDEQFRLMDKSYITYQMKESFGYKLLTKEKQFYLDNYPGIVAEKGNIDEIMLMIAKGEKR